MQVQVNRPIPETTINNLANSHEDTLLLLDLMRHKRQQEGQKKRVRNEDRKTCPKFGHPQKSKNLENLPRNDSMTKLTAGGYDSGDGIAAEKEEAGGKFSLSSLLELQDCHIHHWGNLNLFTPHLQIF